MGTRARVTTVAGAATLLCAASTFGGGFSAFAAPSAAPAQTVASTATPVLSPASAPALASAPTPVLVAFCGETVRGTPGQRVGVRGVGLSVVEVGSVPSQGSSTLDATPALRQLEGPLAPLCTITAESLSPVTAPVIPVIMPVLTAVLDKIKNPLPGLSAPPASSTPRTAAPALAPRPEAARAPALPFPALGHFAGPVMPSDFPFALGRYNSGFPRYNFADLLVLGHPGALGRLSAGMLTADLFGTPQVSNGSGFGKLSAAANDVAAAGRVTELPASGVERVALPVLVAVLMLAGVIAALLRGWVLGRR